MPRHLCETCGVQQRDAPTPPERCPICEDERQYVGHGGQSWTTPARLAATHRPRVEAHEPGLHGIGTTPGFAIGQRALLVIRPGGNLLWDCTPLVDAATVEAVAALGGVASIAISHPHFHAAMADWADAFDAPIHLHAGCRHWVQCPHPRITYWEGGATRSRRRHDAAAHRRALRRERRVSLGGGRRRAAARCSPVTACRWWPIATGSASCAATRT